jgi:hypothetical protein
MAGTMMGVFIPRVRFSKLQQLGDIHSYDLRNLAERYRTRAQRCSGLESLKGLYINGRSRGEFELRQAEHSAMPNDQLAELICSGRNHQVSPQRQK